MASGLSRYAKNKVLNEMFGAVAFSAPATLYIALLKSAATETSTGTSIKATEVNYDNYVRYALTNSGGWSTSTLGTLSNAAEIRFAVSGGTSNTLTHFAICDDTYANGGNMLAFGQLTTGKTYETGDRPVFEAGAITVTINDTV